MVLRQAFRALGGTALVAIPAAGAAGMYKYETDEGTRRSAYFWSQAMPMYLHYRWVQSRVQHLPDEEQDKAYQPLHEKYAPKALEILLHLRGFYIKIGQVGSTRHDFVPKEYLEKICTLQDDVPAQGFPYVKEVIEETMGRPIYEIFKDFDHVPIGAASIGQVHHAHLKDGREVAVKVMYPEVERLFRSDIETIKNFLRLAQPEHLPMIKEIEKQFLTEFNYNREARNLEMIRLHMARRYGDRIAVPRALYCNKSVLIMEFLKGEKLQKALQHNLEVIARLKGVTPQSLMQDMNEREARGETVRGASKAQIQQWRTYLRAENAVRNTGVALHNYLLRPLSLFTVPAKPWAGMELPLNLEEMMDLLLEVHGHQILFDGCFNGDPHPGNMLLVGDRLGLIDCGQVKHINLEQRLQLARLIVAIANKDKEAVVKYYVDMGFRTRDMNPDVIYKAACVAFDRDDKESLGGVNIQQFLEDLNRLDPVISMPDDFVLAARVAVLLRGLGYALKYHYSTAKYWAPMAQKLLTEYGDDVPDKVLW